MYSYYVICMVKWWECIHLSNMKAWWVCESGLCDEIFPRWRHCDIAKLVT